MNVATMAIMTIAIILSTLSSMSPIAAQSTPAAALLVLSKRDQTLAIVDPASLQVLTILPAGDLTRSLSPAGRGCEGPSAMCTRVDAARSVVMAEGHCRLGSWD